jgi:hypothetical protein
MTSRLCTPVKATPNWNSLMQQAIVRAKDTGDKRYQVFLDAYNKGVIQETLRRYGIISEADILREFPSK